MSRRIVISIVVGLALLFAVWLLAPAVDPGQEAKPLSPEGEAQVPGAITPETPNLPVPADTPRAPVAAPLAARSNTVPAAASSVPNPGPTSTPASPPPPLAAPVSLPVVSPAPGVASPMVSPPSAPPADAAESSGEAVAIDLDKVKLSLRDFRTMMGENPTGTNAEIARALNGSNPKHARLLQEGLTQNPNGELVDRWGTPYFFHQLSKDQMEIRSAGPDRKMWNEDDSVAN